MRTLFAIMAAVSLSAEGTIVSTVTGALSRGDLASAERDLRSYQARQGVTPEMLEALSWISRAEAASKLWDQAETSAAETLRLSKSVLKTEKMDSEPHLPVALGAAIEVHAQALEHKGQHEAAVAFLRRQLAAYGSTSIGPRVQKNLLLLTLEGHVAPELKETEFLGPKPPTLASLRGRPVLLFFWAHWCSDCKADAAIIAQVRHDFASRGLAVLAPTQRYGYAARGEETTPDKETKYIDQVRHQFYGSLLDAPAPIGEQNFKNYGASTTPTIVLIDSHGLVRLYHPGAMTYPELTAAVSKLG